MPQETGRDDVEFREKLMILVVVHCGSCRGSSDQRRLGGSKASHLAMDLSNNIGGIERTTSTAFLFDFEKKTSCWRKSDCR